MPSGAKKRARKKQKNQSNNTSSASTKTNEKMVDAVKHQDEKDSNVGEVSSLTSQNRNQRSISTDVNEKTTKNGEDVVQTDVGVKNKDEKIEQDELSTSNNSASSSDDEPRGIKNNPSVADYSAAVYPVEATDLLSETPRVDEITSCDEKAEVKSSLENKVGTSDPRECEVQEKEDRLTNADDASNALVNSGEGGKDSVTQPLLEHPLKKTSWKNCCGLFELFTGSAS